MQRRTEHKKGKQKDDETQELGTTRLSKETKGPSFLNVKMELSDPSPF